MKIKGLYVADIINPTDLTMTLEFGFVEQAVICRESKTGYINIETDRIYSKDHTVMGVCRITSPDKVYPLSDYYFAIGIRKPNKHANKNELHENVKRLRKRKLI